MPVRTPGSTNSGLILKYPRAIDSKTLLRGGTTDATMSASIADASIPASERRLRARIPYSSTVRSRTVVSRQWARSLVFSYTPRTVLVFLTSITSSMPRPPVLDSRSPGFRRPPPVPGRPSGPAGLDDLAERHARRATVRLRQQQGAFFVHAGHAALRSTRGAFHDDDVSRRQCGQRLPLPQKLGPMPGDQPGVATLEAAEEGPQDDGAIDHSAQLDPHRGGAIQDLGGEILPPLIDVHAQPQHHLANHRVGAARLREDARDLPSGDHHIIGPLDRRRQTADLAQGFDDGHRGGEREQRGPHRGDAGAQDQGD